MLLQILVATALLGLSKNCQAYNENSPNYKWSPQYLGARASPIVYSSQLSAPRRVSSMIHKKAIKFNEHFSCSYLALPQFMEYPLQ